jgi:hypothetical protein
MNCASLGCLEIPRKTIKLGKTKKQRRSEKLRQEAKRSREWMLYTKTSGEFYNIVFPKDNGYICANIPINLGSKGIDE